MRAVNEQLQGSTHGREIGANIDEVGDKQQRNRKAQHPGRIVPPQVLRDPLPGYSADTGANSLDRCHQRVAEQHGPAKGIAELRSDLAVGGNAARIVVGCTGDQPRPQYAQQAGASLRQLCAQDRFQPPHLIPLD